MKLENLKKRYLTYSIPKLKKLTNAQQEVRRKNLKIEYQEKGIIMCELKLAGCWKDNALSFAHKNKRWKYIRRPLELWTFKETILACVPCHQIIEGDRDLTEKFFKKLRNN